MPSANPLSSSSQFSKPISISFGTSKPKASPVPPPKKRPHSALADNSDGEDEGQPAAQLVSGFDHSGAVVTNGRKEEKALLVIQGEKNRDWREESRKKRRKNLLPAEVQAARSGTYAELKAAQVDRDEVSKQSGISFVQRDGDGDAQMTEGQASLQAPEGEKANHAIIKTADEEAMEALLGKEKKSTLVLPMPSDDRNGDERDDDNYANEDERFRADVAARPDVSTLDEYDAVPVDGFGAALMRGMGWKDGDPVGKRRTLLTTSNNTTTTSSNNKPRIVERRPAFLGIGAKATPTGVNDEELGAWGKGAAAAAKGKRKTDLTYHPVILKNSVTGEMLTEEELEAKKQQKKKKQEMDMNGGGSRKEDDWRERRDRNLAADGRRKEEKRLLLIEEEKDVHRSSSSTTTTNTTRRERSHSKERNGHSSSHSHSSRRRSRSRSRSKERNYRHHGSSSTSSSRRERRERSPHRSSSRRDRSPDSFDERERERERRYGRW